MVYYMSRTRKDGSIVNGPAAETMDKLQVISDASISGNDGSTTEGNGGVMDWKNDALAKVKGPEKGGRIRCLGKVVVCKSQGSRSNDDQVPALKAKIHELEDEIKEMKDKRADEAKELKEMRERQEVMVRFMSAVKEPLSNLNISSIFNDLNTQVDNDAYSAYEHHPHVNPTSSHASRNQISDPRNKGKR